MGLPMIGHILEPLWIVKEFKKVILIYKKLGKAKISQFHRKFKKYFFDYFALKISKNKFPGEI